MRSLTTSLQGRVVALVLVAVAVLWGAAAALAWRETRHELDELLDGHLAQAAAMLVAQSGDIDDDALEDAPTLHRYAPRVAFQVWHEHELVLRSANAPTTPMSERDRGFETRRLEDGETWRLFASSGAKHDMRVVVGERVDARQDILAVLLKTLLGPLLVALPLLGLAVWAAVRTGLKPLRSLSQTLAARPPGALEPVALAQPLREMNPLLNALNDLLARMAELLESERRFTADAAHELRTPIAAIRTQAQVALAANADDAERQHALQATLAGCDRASRLVSQLLQLSRLEAAGRQTLQNVDLGALSRRVVAELMPAALAKHQDVAMEGPEHCPVPGDEALLGALLRNLVDNAIRYAPPGARIELRITPGATPRWALEDSGPGLSEADLQRLGQRFFRVLGNDAPGSGLGWSIVQRIARALGLQVRAERSSRLGGLAVTLDWPTPVTATPTIPGSHPGGR